MGRRRWPQAVCVGGAGMAAELGGGMRTFQGHKQPLKAALRPAFSQAPLWPAAGEAGGKEMSFKPSFLRAPWSESLGLSGLHVLLGWVVGKRWGSERKQRNSCSSALEECPGGAGKAELGVGLRDTRRAFWGMTPREGIPGYSLHRERGLPAPCCWLPWESLAARPSPWVGHGACGVPGLDSQQTLRPRCPQVP